MHEPGDAAMMGCGTRVLVLLLLFAASAFSQAPAPKVEHVPPPDSTWTADATFTPIKSITDLGLGAIQGVVVRDGKVYAYGDVVFANPRVGVIREYTLDLEFTGREVRLTKDGKPLILHPTGLTWDDEFGTRLGDTVLKKAVMYRLNWERAWRDGNLDHAILATISDDAAINGCRPEFVKFAGKTWVASSDYGDVHPEIRLYDPAGLGAAKRSSSPSVATRTILAGAFNQNMHWDAKLGQLVCVQNVVEGRGWRLDYVDLKSAADDGRVSAPNARVKTMTFTSHDELEGFWPLDGDRVLIAVARRKDNLMLGTIKSDTPRQSPPGTP